MLTKRYCSAGKLEGYGASDQPSLRNQNTALSASTSDVAAFSPRSGNHVFSSSCDSMPVAVNAGQRYIRIHHESKHSSISKMLLVDEKITARGLITQALVKLRMPLSLIDKYVLLIRGSKSEQEQILTNNEIVMEIMESHSGVESGQAAALFGTDPSAARIILTQATHVQHGELVQMTFCAEGSSVELCKSFHVARGTTVAELVSLALPKFKLSGLLDHFQIIERNSTTMKSREMALMDCVLDGDNGEGVGGKDRRHPMLVNFLLKKLSSDAGAAPKASSPTCTLGKELIRAIGRDPGNFSCADCHEPNPTFISSNMGITLCAECAISHCNLFINHTNFVSKVRPIKFYSWTKNSVMVLSSRGNSEAAKCVQPARMPHHPVTAMNRFNVLKQKYTIETMDSNENKKLHEAVCKNNIRQVIEALQCGADPNVPIAKHLYPLHVACFNDNSCVIDLLVRWGANPCQTDSNGHTPLYYTRISGNELNASKMISYQTFYECVCNRAEPDDDCFFQSLLVLSQQLGMPVRTTNQETPQFSMLLQEAFREADRRCKEGSIPSPISYSSNEESASKNDGSCNSLSRLSLSEFRSLMDLLVEELGIREFIALHYDMWRKGAAKGRCAVGEAGHSAGGSAISDNQINRPGWLLRLKKRQCHESTEATRYKRAITHSNSICSRAEDNSDSGSISGAKLMSDFRPAGRSMLAMSADEMAVMDDDVPNAAGCAPKGRKDAAISDSMEMMRIAPPASEGQHPMFAGLDELLQAIKAASQELKEHEQGDVQAVSLLNAKLADSVLVLLDRVSAVKNAAMIRVADIDAFELKGLLHDQFTEASTARIVQLAQNVVQATMAMIA